MMPEIMVREARIEDAEAIAQIHVETWQHAYRGQMPDALLDGLSVEGRLEWRVRILTEPPAKFHSLVAVGDDGKILGFCDVGASREPDAGEADGTLYAIYVTPAAMGQGVGSALIDEGVRQLRAEGFTRATLWVLESNTPTRDFYERRGWMADGTSKTEMWDGFGLAVVRYGLALN